MNNRTLDINISDGDDRLEELDAAVDAASDQDRRTAITAGGKIIAVVVTAEDLARLEALDTALLGGYPAFQDAMHRAAAATVQPPRPGQAGDTLSRTAGMLFTLWQLADAAPSYRDPAAIERWLRDGQR